jgi:hypothetical protein
MLGHQVRVAGVSRLMRRRVRLHRAQFALVLQEHRYVCSMPSRSAIFACQPRPCGRFTVGVDRITLAQVERVAAGEPQVVDSSAWRALYSAAADGNCTGRVAFPLPEKRQCPAKTSMDVLAKVVTAMQSNGCVCGKSSYRHARGAFYSPAVTGIRRRQAC